MENQLTIDVVDEVTGLVEPRALDLSGDPAQCRFHLRGVPGANAVQVRVRSSESVILLAEIPSASEALPIRLGREPGRPAATGVRLAPYYFSGTRF